MSKILQPFALLTLFCCLGGFVLSQEKPPTSDEKREAEKAWDALVRAKGGREKLHSVSSLLIELGPDSKKHDRQSTLFVLPYLYWKSSYDISGKNIWLTVIDGQKNMAYTAGEEGAPENKLPDNRSGDYPGYFAEWFGEEILPLLLETKWYKPEIVRVSSFKAGKKKMESIQTVVRKCRMDFIFEQEDLLVQQVDIYDKEGVRWKTMKFSDYEDMNGIKMPQQWDETYGYEKRYYSHSPFRISLNVNYDPDIFTLPLQATTIDAWKRRQ